MEICKIDDKVLTFARYSSLAEMLLGLSAYFIEPIAFLIGGLIVSLSALSCVLVGYFFMRWPTAFWHGHFWPYYCESVAKRKPTLKTFFVDNWAVLAICIYAFYARNATIACGLLGAMACFSAIVLLQSFFASNSTKR